MRRSSGTTLVSSSVAPRGAPSRRQPRRLHCAVMRKSEAAAASRELSRSWTWRSTARRSSRSRPLVHRGARARSVTWPVGYEDQPRRRRARRAEGHHLPSDLFAETLRASSWSTQGARKCWCSTGGVRRITAGCSRFGRRLGCCRWRRSLSQIQRVNRQHELELFETFFKSSKV